MQVPKTQEIEGSGGLPGPAEGERLGELQSFHFFENYSYWEKGVISQPLCVASEPPSSYPGTRVTVTVAPRSLNAHPKI